MEFNPAKLTKKEFYKLITGTIIPRPIGWISTVNKAGQPNLAPFSFFTGVCSNPPTILFCPAVRGKGWEEKDTFQNVETTKEFVVNIVSVNLVEQMSKTSTELPANINEFDYANLTELPSKIVKPPRVGESLIHLECKLSQIIKIGDGGIGSGSIVVGEVVYMHVDDKVLLPNHKIDTAALNPIGRLAGPYYGGIGEIYSIFREKSQIKKPNSKE
jgi:flavin reductase (DIM6/NTAB) family NADH-FMN oxidoreductase RutF